MWNDLLVNLALLIAGVTVITLTYRPGSGREPLTLLVVRYLSTVALAFILMLNTVTLLPGFQFDLRGVVIALAARRYGLLAGALVVLPIAAYRWSLGGPAAVPGITALFLIALLAGAPTGLLRRTPKFWNDNLFRQWWVPFGVFGLAALPTFPAFYLAGRPIVQAVPVYLIVTVLSAVGMMMAYAVKQSRLRSLVRTEQLELLAYLDSLTGSFNRRRFDDDFAQAEQPAYLLLLDIDHFKHINDTYGHDHGDKVLVALVQTLKEAVRPTDGVYRLGGEEFALLLAPCHETRVEQVVERVRVRVQELVAVRAGLSTECITVSGGLTRLGGEKIEVLRAADELLYHAKASGRNRVLSDTPLPSDGTAALRLAPMVH